jgi:hypothetical protein
MTWPQKRGVLDEAGDTGDAKGSSRYLVIAVVLTSNLHWLRKAALRAIRRMNKRSLPELKAKHTPDKVMIQLLEDVAALDIEIAAVVLDKQKVKQPEDSEDLYRQVCARVVRRCLEKYPHFSLSVDKRYTNQQLRDRLVMAIFESTPHLPGDVVCEYADSEREKAMQVVDAVAWAVFQKYERGNETFYRIIRDRIIVEEMLER